MIINKSNFMCPNLYTLVMLQYSITIEFSHLLQLFSPVVWVQSYCVSAVLLFAVLLYECSPIAWVQSYCLSAVLLFEYSPITLN